MKCSCLRKVLIVFTCQVCFICSISKVAAQKVKYSRQNVFISNPDHLQLVANIGGNQHLVTFNDNENPEIFIFNNELELQSTVKVPFKFPERSVVSVIPFGDFYYVYIRPVLTRQHVLWKIDSNGNCTDFTVSLQKLLVSQLHNIKLGFQLVSYQAHLWMVYHTDLDNNEKNTVVMVQTDSLLNVLFTNKVIYDFKSDEEKLQKEVLIFGKYLLALKAGRSGTTLELLKINLASGLAITNTFSSSGYFYTQSALNINSIDSSITISALLTEPRNGNATPKQFVFVSRLNKNLFQQTPFTILRSQFKKNTGTSFLQVDGRSEWMRFRIRGEQRNNAAVANDVSLYQDLTTDNNADAIKDVSRLLQKSELGNAPAEAWNAFQGIRFTLLDTSLEIKCDSLVSNTKDFYTIKADQFIRFVVNDKEYMLLGQQFVKKSKGLLLVNANDTQQLIYTDLRVNDRNDYLLSKSRIIPQRGIIIPYTHKPEAGLIKISME